jgi:acetyl esterase/lipase
MRRSPASLSIAIFAAAFFVVHSARADEPADKPKIELLWPAGAPDAKGSEPADKPELHIYLPAKENLAGTGIVVCPGGGYGALAMGHEGRDVAAWLNDNGIAAFVVKYRLGPRYRHPAPLQDAQRALRTVRSRAKELGIDPAKIGILGFSAGGHLASTAGTHFDDGRADAKDPIDRASCRPDFMILGYPVISFGTEHTHLGSQRNLLGDKPDAKLVESLSNDKQVTSRTPPTFLVHTTEDKPVPPENSVLFYLACRKAGVPAELHLYEKGQHGLGLGGKDAAFATWPQHCITWLKGRGMLKR